MISTPWASIHNLADDPTCQKRRPYTETTYSQNADGTWTYTTTNPDTSGHHNLNVLNSISNGDVLVIHLKSDTTSLDNTYFGTSSNGSCTTRLATQSDGTDHWIAMRANITASPFYVWVQPLGKTDASQPHSITLINRAHYTAEQFEGLLSLSLSLPFGGRYFDSTTQPLP